MKYALCSVHRAMPGQMVGCIHDEDILEATKDHVNSDKETLVKLMVDAGRRYLISVPVVVEVDVDDCWS